MPWRQVNGILKICKLRLKNIYSVLILLYVNQDVVGFEIYVI